MSPEPNVKKCASASNPPADSDHRKRRRNRTTQSCLNCHNSKRMCDRKRPACSRCTQLGLTGICVYEIDDPNQRQDSEDENARLLKRVAELEGVIRELKNKPHPRWSQSPGNQVDRMHSDPHLSDGADRQNLPSDTSSLLSSSESSESSLFECRSTCSSSVKSSDISSSVPILSSCRPSLHLEHHKSSPESTPSPSLMTPTEEYDHSHFTTTIQPAMSFDYDLSSLFHGHSNLTACYDDGMLQYQLDESCFVTQHVDLGQCGCLQEFPNYSAVLELSVRLRRAADVLSQSPSHQLGSSCLLNQRISDFDAFVTAALDYLMTSQEASLMRQEASCLNSGMLTLNHLYRPSRHRPSSQALETSLEVCDVMDVNPPFPHDDPLMSWEPFQWTTCSV